MKRVITIIFSSIVLASCNPTDDSKDAIEVDKNEMNSTSSEEVAIEVNGQEYEPSVLPGCEAGDSCIEIKGDGDVVMFEGSSGEEVKPTEVKADIGDTLSLLFPKDIHEPNSLHYTKINGATYTDEKIENNQIEVSGDKNKNITYLIHAKWNSPDESRTNIFYAFSVN
ncbi:hypothetical protein H0266_14620 [Halobacillus locisalis]|uniref:Lipoprotein n=1 Tax=Halobacillus locisalis TaxID=220753 RepID=A0A838CW14_9BACI|nr:hypothetical protein [Halobacillus locisalis]MBA2176128.1 hypothetical protein [Halobacillus locisalis]